MLNDEESLHKRLKPYRRNIPRDLFNESKLLKCMGQVSLLHHDGEDGGLLTITIKNPRLGFKIAQDPSDGVLYIINLFVHRKDGRRIMMGTKYNSKYPYPLVYNFEDEEYGDVFNDNGSFSDEFKVLIGL